MLVSSGYGRRVATEQAPCAKVYLFGGSSMSWHLGCLVEDSGKRARAEEKNPVHSAARLPTSILVGHLLSLGFVRSLFWFALTGADCGNRAGVQWW